MFAVGENRLFPFSMTDGIDGKAIPCKQVEKGAVSPDGQYYIFTRFHGFLGDRVNAYILRLSDGRTVQLKGLSATERVFSFFWVSRREA